jgi:hypothetical protein
MGSSSISLTVVSWILVAVGGLLSFAAAVPLRGPDAVTIGALGGLVWIVGVLLQFVLAARTLARRKNRL